ncbi:MAG: hypothetical protein HYY37_00825 [Candidatus Aenigmarchaeota archaeon]|nr:hypothetical protein [Candidatus Aenigmarchaeota archaeon]
MKYRIAAVLFSFFTFLPAAMAHCPLCSAATGMAVATTRIYGIDDAVVGLFIGGFAVSTALWMHNVAFKRNGKKMMIAYQQHIFVLVSLALTLVTVYLAGMLDSKYLIFGMDKLFFGTIAGTAVASLAFVAHQQLRAGNGNSNFIPMQGIILPLAALVVASVGMYALGWIA